MSFAFRNIYVVPMTPKRKGYEKQKSITDLRDVASTNQSYQQLLLLQQQQAAAKATCQQQSIANQKKINDLLPLQAEITAAITAENAQIASQQTQLSSNNVNLSALQSAGITSTTGGVMTLTPGAAALLPMTIGATTFGTTADVQNHINATNGLLHSMILNQNSVTGPDANFTKMNLSKTPYNNLLPYQKTAYTGSNTATFAQTVHTSTTPQNIVNLQSYNDTTKIPPVQGLQGQLTNINNNITSLHIDCSQAGAAIQSQIDAMQLLTIQSLIKDQSKALGYKLKANPVALALQFKALQSADPSANILQFVDSQVRNNSALISSANRGINNLGQKVNTLTKAVEGKPDFQAQLKEQMNQYNLFDPAVCGLVAMDNDGSILSSSKYHIPFQFIDVEKIKVGKAANYGAESPIGRYEEVQVYSHSTAMTIDIPLSYMAFESGYNSDEGFIQEVKDRFLAATFPIYGKYQKSGVRTYGAPNKFLLNMFEKFVNVPVIITNVTFEDVGGIDNYTWLSMGFKISIQLKTSYRVAQVISAEDVVDKGLRALANVNNL